MIVSRFIAIPLLAAFSLVVSLALLQVQPVDEASLVITQLSAKGSV